MNLNLSTINQQLVFSAKRRDRSSPATIVRLIKATRENDTYDHTKHFHLPEVILQEIKPIFRDLAKPELLQKCLRASVRGFAWFAYPPLEAQPLLHPSAPPSPNPSPFRKCSGFVGGGRNCSALSTCSFATSR
ncbi:hypothetical protein J6590_035698 [Homalodisca vitripennis]|nr:hypothetical protein J6590_035698 [Homalodisca vitripennis]